MILIAAEAAWNTPQIQFVTVEFHSTFRITLISLIVSVVLFNVMTTRSKSFLQNTVLAYSSKIIVRM
jgi:hypothetical protein